MGSIDQDLISDLQAQVAQRKVEEAQKKSAAWYGRSGVIGVILAALWKFKAIMLLGLGKLQFLLGAAKLLTLGKVFLSGGTMLLSVAAYATIFGFPYALGFVLLIFIHEMGHVLALRYYKLPSSVPIFIPFVGAFVALKEMPPNVKIEAIVGLAGPIMGSVAAAGCYAVYQAGGSTLWLSLAYVGFLINLFNLLPILPLDGGRVVAAINPWMWAFGLVAFGVYFVMRPNPIVLVLILLSLPRVWKVFRGQTDADYYSVSPSVRMGMGIAYFGLALVLGVAMMNSHEMLQSIHPV